MRPPLKPPPEHVPGLVSVVVPCFNQAHFLADAISSVRDQDDARTEILVVDDASSDAPEAVVARFPGVTLLRQERNLGLAGARNAGLQVAKGEFVVFLDADDWLLPGAIAAGIASLARDASAGFSFGGYRCVRADGSLMWEQRPTPDDNLYGSLLTRNVVEMIATVMFRRGAILEVGSLDASLRACEDYDLLLRISRVRPALQHAAIVACYRRHGLNLSRNNALMLRTSVRALSKQRANVIHTPELLVRYEEGQRFWRTWYGSRLFTEARTEAKQGKVLGRTLRNAATLLTHVPFADLLKWYRQGTGEIRSDY